MAGRFSINAVFGGRDGLSRIVSKVESRLGRFSRKAGAGFTAIERGTRNVVSGLSSIATKALVVGGILGGIGAAGLFNIGKTGADFEEAITAVGAVGLQTRDQIADLEKKALDLGRTTKFTATEAANAMEIMARAGFKNEEILSGVSGVLNAAAASGLEMAEVADHVSNVLKGMGLATSEATRVADVLALASSKTNSTIGSLGESMSNVASTARQLNVPLESVVAAVASLQDVGLDASVAGSSLNTMLTKMAKPSKGVAAQMKQWGVSFKDAKGNMLPFEKVLANISKAAEKSGGNFDQVAFLADLVGLRGQKAAANLKDLFNSGKLSTLTEQLQGASGAAGKMAELRMDNLKGDLTLLNSAADGVKVALFGLESGPLRNVVQGVTAWIDANKTLIKVRVLEFIENATFAAKLFGAGAREGFTAAADAAKIVLAPLVGLNDLLGIKGRTWPANVRDLGRALGFLAVATGGFLAFSLAIKGARAALFALELVAGAVKLTIGAGTLVVRGAAGAYGLLSAATKSSTAASIAQTLAEKARSAAVAIGTLGTTRLTFATIGNRIATWASQAATVAHNLATRAATAAQAIYAAIVNRQKAATIASTAATVGSRLAHAAFAAGLGIVTAAQTVYRIATGGATAATAAGIPVAGAANAALLPLIVTLGAAAAAVGALMLAWNQWQELSKQTGGAEGVWEGIKSLAGGDGFFAGVDEHLNEQARAEAAKRQGPQVVTQADRVSKSIEESSSTTTSKSEVTIKDKTGRAQFTKPPKKGSGIKLEPSGAL